MDIKSPLTGSSDISLVKILEAGRLIDDWKNTFNIDITNELDGIDKIYLYQCNETKLKFFIPLNIAGSSQLYEKLQELNDYYIPHKWEHEIALQNLSEGETILEVGCAFGSFVETGIQAGFQVKGIEINQKAIKIASDKGLPVENINLQDFARLYPKSMDVVCSFQVLEHIPDPKSFLKSCLTILKPNGKLILGLPNANSYLKYQTILLDMPPHHMTQWQEETVRSLEKFFPVKIEKIMREPLSSYHVRWGYLESYSSYFRSLSPIAKLVFNGYTLPIYEKLINAGLRRFLTGQSLYAQFKKIE